MKNNTYKIENNDFQINQLKNQIPALSEEVTAMKLDIEDNIPKKQETWDKSKDILTKEIKIEMPTVK